VRYDEFIVEKEQVMDTQARFRGTLMGLAVGDALGTTLEFARPGTFAPITGIMGGGPYRLAPGEWTDDTAMALCLAASLVEQGSFDLQDQMARYVRWFRTGYMSCTSTCFAIDAQVEKALVQYEISGDCGLGGKSTQCVSNASLVRLAPVPLFFAYDPLVAIERSGGSSLTTHAAVTAVDACRYFGGLLVGALKGTSKAALLSARYAPLPGYWDQQALAPEVDEVASGSFKHFASPFTMGNGHVVRTLEAALWAFYHGDSFEEGCLLAANLGDDADTTAAVYGQLAGAYYGIEGIPEVWRRSVAWGDRLMTMADRLLILARMRQLAVSNE
jgi:ADP-ribosylglycohydrolase